MSDGSAEPIIPAQAAPEPTRSRGSDALQLSAGERSAMLPKLPPLAGYHIVPLPPL